MLGALTNPSLHCTVNTHCTRVTCTRTKRGGGGRAIVKNSECGGEWCHEWIAAGGRRHRNPVFSCRIMGAITLDLYVLSSTQKVHGANLYFWVKVWRHHQNGS